MFFIADYIAAALAIKDTTSGKVEHNTESESLPLVHAAFQTLLVERGIPCCPDVTALQTLTAAETTMAFLIGSGLYLYVEGETGDYASADGLGYWNRQLFLSANDLTNFNLNTPPTNGQALIWNAGESKWKAGNPTVSALAYANITSKPTQLTDLASTDVLIKLFNGASNKSIGTSTVGSGNIILTPKGNSITSATNSTVITAESIPNMLTVTDSTIITDMATLRPGGVDFTVNQCTIIGNTGSLASYFTGNVLEGLIIIGHAGQVVMVKEATGDLTLPYGTILGDQSGANTVVGNNLAVSGATALGDDATVAGSIAATGYVKTGQWNTAGRPASPSAGMIGYNTTLVSMEYYNGSGWQSF